MLAEADFLFSYADRTRVVPGRSLRRLHDSRPYHPWRPIRRATTGVQPGDTERRIRAAQVGSAIIAQELQEQEGKQEGKEKSHGKGKRRIETDANSAQATSLKKQCIAISPSLGQPWKQLRQFPARAYTYNRGPHHSKLAAPARLAAATDSNSNLAEIEMVETETEDEDEDGPTPATLYLIRAAGNTHI